MIYDFPKQEEPIRQGDIFSGIPRVEISLSKMPVIIDNNVQVTSWEEIASSNKTVETIVSVKPVISIVASQDCDAIRAPDITLFEIKEFRDVELKSKDTQSVRKWIKIITQHSRINQKWFYLPPDEKLGFNTKMGVDFLVTLRVTRLDLEKYIYLRKGRLNRIAEKHFRERVADFFRRYSYNEWYALDRQEMSVYQEEYPDAEPYPWQLPQNISEEKNKITP